MTIVHRTQKHLETISEATRQPENNNFEQNDAPCKGHFPRHRNLRNRPWWDTLKKMRDEVEDWLIMATCFTVLFVCILWFLGKASLIFSSILFPMLDAMGTAFATTVAGSSSKHSGGPRFHELPWKPEVYRVPHSHKIVGDRSYNYANLRQEIDDIFPKDHTRSLQAVAGMKKYTSVETLPTIPLDHNSDQLPQPAYDIYNCPETPPSGYPFQWKIMKLVDNWNPENTTVPNTIFNGLCVFDFENDFDKAMTYRNLELPFVMTKDPRIAATAERWNSPGYMERMLGDVQHRTTRSDTNHFLYAVPPRQPPKAKLRTRRTAPPGWKDPTQSMRMSYKDWLERANVTDDKCTPDQPHWYYRLIGCGLTGPDGSCDKGSSEFLYDELPFFQPTSGGLYLREAEKQKGIHCRFGQKGIVAYNHFDAGRNTIVVLGGTRRYVLSYVVE